MSQPAAHTHAGQATAAWARVVAAALRGRGGRGHLAGDDARGLEHAAVLDVAPVVPRGADGAQPAVERVQHRLLLVGQLPGERALDVGGDVGGRGGARDDGHAALHVPLEQHLRGAAPALRRDAAHDLVAQQRVGHAARAQPAQRRVAHALHALAEAHARELALRQQWVQLHLVDHRLDARARQHRLHLRQAEVGHADGLDQARVHQPLHRAPRVQQAHGGVHLHAAAKVVLAARHPRVGPVHQVQVQMAAPQVGQALLARGAHALRPVLLVPQLGGDE
mmetsp:Transcript_37280/g.94000  ORF Transcript_37280/g.94000 Transcript_37280/m.94000 type:complete len:279 (+) Transcript_37280:174-1010(+)